MIGLGDTVLTSPWLTVPVGTAAVAAVGYKLNALVHLKNRLIGQSATIKKKRDTLLQLKDKFTNMKKNESEIIDKLAFELDEITDESKFLENIDGYLEKLYLHRINYAIILMDPDIKSEISLQKAQNIMDSLKTKYKGKVWGDIEENYLDVVTQMNTYNFI
jgi:hypothetical protein